MPTNRKERAAERRRQEAEANKTLIIPQITPELLEQRRREAAAGSVRPAPAAPPAQPPQPTPAAPARTGRSIRRVQTGQTAQTTRTIQMPRTAPAAPPPAPTEAPSAVQPPASVPETPPVTETSPAPETPAAPPRPQEHAPRAEETRPARRTRAQAEEELAETIRHDHIWLNNPVLVRGLGLASVVVAASDAHNALMLSVATFLLLTATRVVAEAVCHLTGYRFRAVIYCYAAALSYIPVYILLYNLFGADLAVLGIYLPLLVVDPVVVKRMEFSDRESVGHALRLGINNSLGVCIATMLVGCLRELLAAGTVFGRTILNYSLLPLAGEVAGGFLLVGVLAAGWTAVSSAYVRFKEEEVRRLYAKRKH